jgi:hypothetical protein
MVAWVGREEDAVVAFGREEDAVAADTSQTYL